MIKNILLILGLIVIFSACNKEASKQDQPYLVVLSLDGFRWDYTHNAHTPTLDSLKAAGVVAESLKPSYPTKTFPNHYSMATGLYPDHHGLVDNNFHATDLDREYKMKNREAVEDGTFYGGEPIWVTAEKQDVISATFFWVGSEAEIKGVRPSFWYKYDWTIPFNDRIDSIVNWLSLPESKRPHLIMWYYSEPDHTGHEAGPESEETRLLIEELDTYLNDFFTQMRKLPVFDQLNFIITSDHGMNATSNDRTIAIEQIIDTNDIEFIDGISPNVNIKVKEGRLEHVFTALQNTPNLEVWKHGELPERLHYGKNIRTHDICMVADPGWTFVNSKYPDAIAGAHGYDNDLKDMHAIFYASGPAFKSNYTHPTFENVNLYVLFAEILNITAVETDGNISNVEQMLNK
ncbi:MAG: ectonucleotide pyrophosphatase/phosphodiesterase [Bacteroidales bacterium]|jgi:alkaline phosphatase D|nr:ectonucleotide pyrophosphatase/phosphodiesterase [Bacteroidales bacterium]